MNDSMLFEIHAIAGWDMSGFDDWLNDPRHWTGHEHLRQELIGQREELVHIFNTYYFDTERIHAHARLLRLSAEKTSMLIAGQRLETQLASRKQQAKTAAKARRPNAESKLKRRILDAMRPSSLEKRPFKEFLRGWEGHPIDGLSIRELTTGSFSVLDDESADPSREYTIQSLTAMYSRSCK